MGINNSTLSYQSKEDALNKMFDQLDDLDITIYYSANKHTHFIVENVNSKNMRRYLRTRPKVDFFGYQYYECYIENESNK
jgi:hypothetical protein